MNTLIVQFRITGEHALGLGSTDELDFRHRIEQILDALLRSRKAGYCDGGQMGAGSMEIFLEDIIDLKHALAIVMNYLTDVELIQYCKIVSIKEGEKSFTVEYPAGATFSMWG